MSTPSKSNAADGAAPAVAVPSSPLATSTTTGGPSPAPPTTEATASVSVTPEAAAAAPVTTATSAAGTAHHPGGHTPMPARFFWITFGYIAALIVVFIVYQVSPGVRRALAGDMGAMPVGVPWFGAMGGALISLTATSSHRSDWDASLEYWHYSRPLVGAIIGSLGALMLLVVVDATTAGAPKLDHLALYVVGFIVGYREQSFRELIKRAADLLISPGQASSTNSSGRTKT